MLFRFENLSIKPGARDSWNLERGTIREMWESFLERYKTPEEVEKFRNSEHLLRFSTRHSGQPGREFLGWDDTPAAGCDFLWARYDLSRAKWADDKEAEEKVIVEKSKID